MLKTVWRQYRKQKLELIPLAKGGWGGWVHWGSGNHTIVGPGTGFPTMEECLDACKAVVTRDIIPEGLV